MNNFSNLINLYSPDEINLLEESGRILSDVLKEVASAVVPGVSMFDLDRLAEGRIRERNAKPSFLGYKQGKERPYPASLCTSINDELVHCVPYKNRVAREGDIIGLDLGVSYKGYMTDMAVTVAVGLVSEVAQRLICATVESLDEVIKILRPGITLGDVGYTVQNFARNAGFAVIRDLVGHGVGRSVHEDPKIPNFGERGKGQKLQAGMVLAFEPMFAEIGYKIEMCPDGWGIRMVDGGLCAHFEKTVVITQSGCSVLTP